MHQSRANTGCSQENSVLSLRLNNDDDDDDILLPKTMNIHKMFLKEC